MNSLRTLAQSTFVAGCALMANELALAGEGATDIGSYRWTNVRPTVPFDPTTWAPRAGLQALELRNDLYVMGGRGPFSFETETVLSMATSGRARTLAPPGRRSRSGSPARVRPACVALRVAYAYEHATDWHRRRPALDWTASAA